MASLPRNKKIFLDISNPGFTTRIINLLAIWPLDKKKKRPLILMLFIIVRMMPPIGVVLCMYAGSALGIPASNGNNHH